MRTITQSSHEYKGYIIRLRAVTYNGFWYKIIKQVPNKSSPDGIKNIFLRERGWNFILPDELLKKAKDYIDNHSKDLEDKLAKSISKLKTS